MKIIYLVHDKIKDLYLDTNNNLSELSANTAFFEKFEEAKELADAGTNIFEGTLLTVRQAYIGLGESYAN